MRKFTKSILALALLLLGVSNASAQGSWVEIKKFNYSDFTGFPYYVMGYVPEWKEGIMTDYGAMYTYKTAAEDGDNVVGEVTTQGGAVYKKILLESAGWHQYFIADGIATAVDGSYKVKALVKASAQVKLNVNMGWGWGSGQSKGTEVTIPQSNDFVEVEWEYDGIGGTSCNLVAQPGTSTATIEWKSVTVYEPGVPASYTDIITNGDLEGTDSRNFWTKNAHSDQTNSLIEDGIGKDGSRGIRITTADRGKTAKDDKGDATWDGDDWDSQFFIQLPQALPAGTKYKVSFDYRASVAGEVETQSHAATPGDYIHWAAIGTLSFTTAWKNYSTSGTVSDDMSKSDKKMHIIAFNLSKNHVATEYFLDNIKFEILSEAVTASELTEAVVVTDPATKAFEIPSAGWGTFVFDRAVSFGSDVEAYTATYESGVAKLNPVTKLAGGKAVIIKGDAGNHTATYIDGTTVPATENDLLPSSGNAQGDGTIYVLAKKEKGEGFYKFEDGAKVPKGKAYLVVPASSAPDFLGFDGGTTSISELNVKSQADGEFFNLAGQRVAQPTKGLYIVNGKKYIVK